MQELKILNAIIGAGKTVLTYTSGLLFTDEYVYKIRKSISNSEVDYGHARLRKMYTILEKEYNSNFCDEDIYIDTLKIVKKGKDEHALVDINSSLPALSYVLKMKKVSHFLIEQLDCLDKEQFKNIGKKLSNTLISLPISKKTFNIKDKVTYEYEGIDRLIKKLSISFTEINATFESCNHFYSYIKDNLNCFIENNSELFIKRAKDGFIKEGHGNLILNNIAFNNNSLSYINCAHYSELLRTNDVVSDLSSLLVDLDFNNKTEFADATVEGFATNINDENFLHLLNFYRAVTALGRAKQTLLNIEWELLEADNARYRGDLEAKVDIEVCEQYKKEFIKFINLATIYSYSLSNVVPLVFAGDADANRSKHALEFREHYPVKLLCYKVTEQSLVNELTLHLNNEVANNCKELYTVSEEKVYYALSLRAKRYVMVGRVPLIDANFTSERFRLILSKEFKHVKYIEFFSSVGKQISDAIYVIEDDKLDNNKIEKSTRNIIKKVIDA